ncbi:hypothetical protein FQN54_007760 [Arachnomyces sp. PD_36]|nr:hypothetical protein FQN54_007760 [Arachnomyces sp. PD_36]
MASRYVSSQLIQTISKGGKSVAVEFVERTTAWVRASGFPAMSVRTDFVQVVQENMDTLQPSTTIVAMKESEHQSDMDKRMHYTAFELDSNRNVLRTSHLVKQK